MSANTELIHGYESCKIATEAVEVYVTLTGGHLAPVTFHLEGRQVFRFAVSKMCELVERIAARNQVEVADIDLLIPHQANRRIIDAATEKLGLPSEKVFVNVDRFGNTSAASIPMALDEAVRAGRLQRGDLVCTVAFGAGLSWGANLIAW